MRGIWLKNLSKWVTGTAAGSKQCLDVNVANTVGVPVIPSNYAYKEHRFHDASATNINASGGAYIELETAAAIANTITEARINWNGGSPILIGKGANAGAVTVFFAVGAGQTLSVGLSATAGDKVWVKALENAAITTGKLTVNFLG